MKRFVLFAFILMLPASTFAETVAVLSGEHDTYTRLVFAIDPDRDWNLVTAQSMATLVFPAQYLEFEDDGVFARIPKTRLTMTQPEQNGGASEYRMTLNCDCEVRTFPYLDAYIVVDISDVPESSIATPPTRHFAPKLGVATLPDGNDSQPEFISWTLPQAPYYVSSPHSVNFPAKTGDFGLTPTQMPDAAPRAAQTDPSQAALAPRIEVDQELQKAVDAARNSLLQQLTLAADQGLLDLNGTIFDVTQPVETEEIFEPEDPLEVLAEPEDEPQVLIQTAITRDARAVLGDGGSQSNDCPSSENLDIASWGSGEEFLVELSQARKKLVREFDEPDFSEFEGLIHTYLRYGFGAEARSYLLEGGQNIAQYSLLMDFAVIVDGQTIQDGSPLANAIDCDGVAGLWAIVGMYPDVGTHINDRRSIIEAFAELPIDIRRLVGPRLASAFLDRGFGTTARQVADILERAPGDHGTEHKLVVGNLMHAEGRTPRAEQVYQALAEENSQVTTDALIDLATLRLTSDQAPPPHLLVDLAASAKIWRGTSKGGELRRLQALWLAKQGEDAAAIDLLVVEIQRDPKHAEMLGRTAETLLSDLSVNMETKSSYAEIVHTYIDFISEDEKANKLRLEIATKLLLAGLPDFSIQILQPMLQRNEADAILTAANANIHAFRPETALMLLHGVAGDPARKLRVEAYLGLAEFEQALEQLKQFTSVSEAIVIPSWFKGDWTELVKTSQFAAEISVKFFPESVGSSGRFDELPLSDTLSLSALQDVLTASKSRSAEIENVLLQQ